jgi:hypothetical protein
MPELHATLVTTAEINIGETHESYSEIHRTRAGNRPALPAL